MSKVLELKEKRAKAWEAAKAFLDSKQGSNGLMSAEDAATYDKMEAEVVDLGKEIDRLERQAVIDAELTKATSTPITNKPKAIRKLKDGNGNYIWQPSVREGEPDRILNRPYRTSIYVPELAAGNRVMAFGDYSYYWIADRQGRSFKRLNELFATTGQVGFLASERVDGKLILSEAVKTLDVKASAK